ncbi:PREDICTED: bone sialoprotein 2 [Miniopterus natalensis]|uniref:bone sialoprotein 2 n=1 Tax=Miniopterus natalensis TaxID=291302 RepID=UPI0007A6BB4E|nr:PREDICTED: bone sialoprotein 2 [Miniopterus natalensis]
MKTALILLSILGMACAFSMKNFHRRAKAEDSEENGVFKYRPRYYLYKHAYFYPPLKRFPVQGSSDSSEENGDGDSSEEEEEEEENSNEEENNEESNENEDEAENATLSATTPGYGEGTTPGAGTYEAEYEPTGTSEYDAAYEVYENGNGEPRGDSYRAYEDEYGYYKGRSYDSYDGHSYYDPQ